MYIVFLDTTSVDNVADYQAVVDAEWQIIYQKLEKIVATGAKVVLSKVWWPPFALARARKPCADRVVAAWVGLCRSFP